jgi:hypothetical protein
MCGHCGCGNKEGATILNLQTGKETAMGGHARGATLKPTWWRADFRS